MAVQHPTEAASRMAVAEAISAWAARNEISAFALAEMTTALLRGDVARIARKQDPNLSDRWGYYPSEATWDLACRLAAAGVAGATTSPPAAAEEPDPFRGFPQ